MKTVLQSGDYQTIWGINQSGQSGFADPNELVYPVNSPSAGVYEEMMLWAACERIPIIGMDLPLSERESGLGENIPYRNGIWKDQIVNFFGKTQIRGLPGCGHRRDRSSQQYTLIRFRTN